MKCVGTFTYLRGRWGGVKGAERIGGKKGGWRGGGGGIEAAMVFHAEKRSQPTVVWFHYGQWEFEFLFSRYRRLKKRKKERRKRKRNEKKNSW